MKNKENRSLKIRALNSVCACVLIGSLLYVLVAGVEAIALGAIALSLLGAATPVVLNGEGILEIFVGIAEALIEGVMVIVDGIITAISGIFG